MNIIKYWTKLLQANDKKYVKKVYYLLYQDILDNPNRKNWCSLLRNLLCSLGFQDVWMFQTVGDINLFLSIVKQRLRDQFCQNWEARLNDSSRALFYRNIVVYRFQPY